MNPLQGLSPEAQEWVKAQILHSVPLVDILRHAPSHWNITYEAVLQIREDIEGELHKPIPLNTTVSMRVTSHPIFREDAHILRNLANILRTEYGIYSLDSHRRGLEMSIAEMVHFLIERHCCVANCQNREIIKKGDEDENE